MRGKRFTIYDLRFTILLALLAAIIPSAAFADAPQRVESFVYGTTYYTGMVYDGTFVPPSVDTVYLLADGKNVLSPRRTLIYFWPITNQYLADWEKMNELVDGKLEVYQQGRLLATVNLQDYIIQYDANDPLTTLNLYLGDQAQAHYATFQGLQTKYTQDQNAYSQAQQAWQDKMDDLLKSYPPGGIPPDQVPKQPDPVPSFTLLSTNLQKGYVISLPAGTYEIQMKLADGSIQPDSKKRLVLFTKQHDGISYDAVPQSRWTAPEKSNEPNSVIYVQPGTVIYLQPYQSGEYNEYAYAHMSDPQDQSSRPDHEKWVPFEPRQGQRLGIVSNGTQVGTVPVASFYVRQLPGSGLGYEVVPFDPKTMDKPSFDGYRIDLGAERSDYIVQLVDEHGAPIPGSQRHILTLNTQRAPWLYALAGLPLLAGALVIAGRRRSARHIKVEE